MTEDRKSKNAISYPASVLTWLNEVTDSIYDDFESRTCQNCKHFTKEFGVYGICQKGMTNHVVWHEGEQWKLIDFYSGCNKFERRRE